MFNSVTIKTDHVPVDVINAVAGALLLLSPWVIGFSGESTAAWSAWISGAVIAAVALGALVAFHQWQGWGNVAAGAWTLIAPWALGFAANGGATVAHVILGAVVAVAAAIELWMVHNRPMSTV